MTPFVLLFESTSNTLSRWVFSATLPHAFFSRRKMILIFGAFPC